MTLTGKVNEYWDQQKPWEKAKQLDDITQRDALHIASSTTIECFRILTIFLKPIVPELAKKGRGLSKYSTSTLEGSLERLTTRTQNQYLQAFDDPY